MKAIEIMFSVILRRRSFDICAAICLRFRPSRNSATAWSISRAVRSCVRAASLPVPSWRAGEGELGEVHAATFVIIARRLGFFGVNFFELAGPITSLPALAGRAARGE